MPRSTQPCCQGESEFNFHSRRSSFFSSVGKRWTKKIKTDKLFRNYSKFYYFRSSLISIILSELPHLQLGSIFNAPVGLRGEIYLKRIELELRRLQWFLSLINLSQVHWRPILFIRYLLLTLWLWLRYFKCKCSGWLKKVLQYHVYNSGPRRWFHIISGVVQGAIDGLVLPLD